MELIPILQATQSLNDNERNQAEQSIALASKRQGFALNLTKLLIDDAGPHHLRQLSGLLLKQFISKHWANMPGDHGDDVVIIHDGEKVRRSTLKLAVSI